MTPNPARIDPGAHLPPAVSPGLGLGQLARRVVGLSGLVAALGVLLAVIVPLLDLRSDDCGPVSCALLQVVGKVLTGLGVGVGVGAAALSALRAGRITAAILALLIAGPALFWSALIADQWRQLQAGTGEVTRMVQVGREYAAAQTGQPAEQLGALLTNGRGSWAVVRITRPDGQRQYALIQRQGDDWRGRALAPDFSRDDLRALGAPIDLMRDAY